MIPKQVLLIVRIIFHPLVIINTLENDLAEAIIIRDIRHLTVVYLGHEFAGLCGVVDLFIDVSASACVLMLANTERQGSATMLGSTAAIEDRQGLARPAWYCNR